MDSEQVKLKKEQPVILKAIVVYLISIVISLFTTSLFGNLYDVIFKPKRGLSLLQFSVGNTFDGFVYGYIFFVSLFTPLLIKRDKRKQLYTWLIGNAIFIFVFLVGGGFKELGLLLILSVIGYLIGQTIVWVKGKVKKG